LSLHNFQLQSFCFHQFVIPQRSSSPQKKKNRLPRGTVLFSLPIFLFPRMSQQSNQRKAVKTKNLCLQGLHTSLSPQILYDRENTILIGYSYSTRTHDEEDIFSSRQKVIRRFVNSHLVFNSYSTVHYE